MEKMIILMLVMSSLIMAASWNSLWKGWLLWKRPVGTDL
jgi:hypothetical protein